MTPVNVNKKKEKKNCFKGRKKEHENKLKCENNFTKITILFLTILKSFHQLF